MTDNPLLVGSLFIALGSTLQCFRWVWVEGGRFKARREAAKLRSEKVAIERESRGLWDIIGWVLVATGGWYTWVGTAFF